VEAVTKGKIMKHLALTISVLFLTLSCATKKPTTAEAQKNLDEKWTPQVGTATKNELIAEFGNPEWCKMQDEGTETCRFYKKKGTKWIGDKETKRDKKPVEQFDQLIADFDSNGVLRNLKSSAQR
jgi:hypothetical protein